MTTDQARDCLISLALALAAVATFAGTTANGFVNFDDDLYVYNNPAVKEGLSRPSIRWAFTNTQAANWHPLTWLSLETDSLLFGLHAAGFHATNVVLHVGNTLLLFWLLRAMTGAALPSACAAAFFAVHPLHVESVAWVSQRKDVLCAFFFLLSLLCWQSYARRTHAWGWYLLALVSFLFSLMAKAMSITLPITLLLLDVWPLNCRGDKADSGTYEPDAGPSTASRRIAEKAPFFLIAAAFAALAALTQGSVGATEFGQSLPFAQRLLMAPMNYATYLRQTFWPVDLAMFYPHPGPILAWWKPAGAGLLLAFITAAALRLSKPCPYLLVGWSWFLAMLSPVIGLVQVGQQATADRYMYLPMIGLAVAVCWGGRFLAGRFRRLRPLVAVGCAICLLTCAVVSARQVTFWRDGVTAWEHTIAVTRPTVLSCNNYGLALLERGREDEAEQSFRKALELDAAAYKPRCNLGALLSKNGRLDEAARHFALALRLHSDDPQLLENFGVVEESRGRIDAAVEYYEMASRFDPPSPTIFQRLQRAHRLREAGR